MTHLPHNGWLPREHQDKLWNYLQDGGKRAFACWHRRAGKDDVCLHYMATAAMRRPASYWYCLPEYAQCRRAIWTSVNPHSGKRRIDEAFPHEIRASTNESEMFIRLVNGSTIQLIGSDSYSTAVGASTAGIVFSEYALANPSAWGYFRPMVEENQGWSIFVTTPRGRNHALDLFQHAQRTPGWFSELLTAEDTGALTAEALAESLNEYTALYGEDMGRALYDQELMCSFNAAVLGSFYAHEMVDVRKQGRISDDVEALPDRPVNWSWDLGVRDDTSLWAFQVVGTQPHILFCHSANSVGLEYYADLIERTEREHGWKHGTDYVPHDAKVREFTSGRTRVETMKAFGLNPQLVHDHAVQDGINAVRRVLPLCVFHSRCEQGISALEQYRREWDDDRKAFRASALHDWTSNYADSFRYFAMGWQRAPLRLVKPPQPTGFHIPPPMDLPRGGIRL